MLISFLQQKADAHLEARIDANDYDESQLVEMRVQMDMPYQMRYTEFERHYGEAVINGKTYTYVKRKIEGDVLVLKCIANETKQQLTKTADSQAQTNGGQDQDNNTGKKHTALKVFSGDFDDKNLFCQLYNQAAIVSLQRTDAASLLAEGVRYTPYQPPRA